LKGEETKPLWNERTQNPSTASPLVTGDAIYVINSAGVLNAVNRATGERLWRLRLKGPFSGSPVAAENGHLYIVSEEGIAQCVDLSGEEGCVVSELELGETILGTPSIADDALYIRSDQTLWKLSPPRQSGVAP
jgi:outer membrane protein assembly factor BamB